MKTFNKEDLITWSNRDKAVIGNEYYFADSLEDLRVSIKNKIPCALININKDNCAYTFKNEHLTYYACLLPADKIIDEPEKKYRACKNIQEFCKLVTGNTTIQSDEQCSLYLIGCKVHIRSKMTYTEFYTNIFTITVNVNNYTEISLLHNSYLSFKELFENYEIEINGEWVPFGVLEND